MPRMKVLKKFRLIMLLVCALFVSHSLADDLDAQSYIELDLQARQLTLNGVNDRLTLIRQNAGLESQLAQDMETQQTIDAVYAAYGTTVSQVVSWAGRNREAITDWLSAHPEDQAEYDRIGREMDSVSALIQALTNQ